MQLLPSTRIHNVFHISLPKRYLGPPPSELPELPVLPSPLEVPKCPLAILDRCFKEGMSTAADQVLVQWAYMPLEEASWVPTDEFVNEHVLNLEDKFLSEDGSIITCSRKGDDELGNEL